MINGDLFLVSATNRLGWSRLCSSVYPGYRWCIGNHDQPRLVSRVGERQARLVAVLQTTLPGLPVVYYGDELGMKNGIIRPSEEQDPLNVIKPGLNQGRDPERTPMQWSADEYAGFSTVKPWLPLAGQHDEVNVATLSQKNDSFLALYTWLLDFRARSDVLKHGGYQTGAAATRSRQEVTCSFLRSRQARPKFLVNTCSKCTRTKQSLLVKCTRYK